MKKQDKIEVINKGIVDVEICVVRHFPCSYFSQNI